MMTEDEMISYLKDHLPYELLMLRYAFQKISSKQEQAQLDWNAYYECFVLHARNLYLFLTNGDAANAKAARFIKGGFESDKTEDTISVFQKLGTQVFHLGIKRPSEQETKVTLDDAEKVNRWVEENFKSFLDKVHDHDRSVLGDRTRLGQNFKLILSRLQVKHSYSVP